MRHRLAVALVTLVAAWPAMAADVGPAHVRARAEVKTTVDRFLRAFENLDWPAFRAAFADDATVFFPTPEPPRRFDGRAAVDAQFERVFEAIRKDASGPPYHRLQPEALTIDMLGDSAALVSFELHNAVRIARRTLVLRRIGEEWRIVHLHASNVPVGG